MKSKLNVKGDVFFEELEKIPIEREYQEYMKMRLTAKELSGNGLSSTKM
ncbi:MAG: hypothetical protein GY874_12005 [Desulfobacteraceae bacterium]|nr:hypothetical protein [Desulfobacteraceae bacterium]